MECVTAQMYKRLKKQDHLIRWEKVPPRAIEAGGLGLISGSGNPRTTDGWTVGKKPNKDHVFP